MNAQWVRCGKPGCHCARGERHGPYWYRFWRDHYGRHKVYVKPADLEAVRAACAAWQAQQGEIAKLPAKDPAVMRWHEGQQRQSKDPVAQIERAIEMAVTTMRLVRLACGGYGRPSDQIKAAVLVGQFREAWRKQGAR